jgi:hypothetical protein|tara:strand:+ start:1294 stop:1518 length:225 start_codon:yes stop_codon:yes gene_type:complete
MSISYKVFAEGGDIDRDQPFDFIPSSITAESFFPADIVFKPNDNIELKIAKNSVHPIKTNDTGAVHASNAEVSR